MLLKACVHVTDDSIVVLRSMLLARGMVLAVVDMMTAGVGRGASVAVGVLVAGVVDRGTGGVPVVDRMLVAAVGVTRVAGGLVAGV